MKCPKCSETLTMTEIRSAMIDYCPKCQGIWISREKFENLMGQSGKSRQPRASDNYDDQENENYGEKRNKRGGFLGGLLENFGGDD